MTLLVLAAGCFPQPEPAPADEHEQGPDSVPDTTDSAEDDSAAAQDSDDPNVGESADTSAPSDWTGPTLDEPIRSWCGQGLTLAGLAPDLDGDGEVDLVFNETGPDETESQPMGVVGSLADVGITQARNAPYVIDTSDLAYDSIGAASGGGDLTGDGVPDMLLGLSPYVDPIAGWVEVFDGSVTVSGRSDPWALISGSDPGQLFGRVAVSADRDGDGVDEVYVAEGTGSSQNHLYEFDALSGSVTVDEADAVWSSAAVSGGGMPAVDRVGDLSGDGLPDLLVGATGADGQFRRYVLAGPEDGRLGDIATATIEGGEPTAGDVRSQPCDYDGDGQADLMTLEEAVDFGRVSGFAGPLSGTRSLDDSDWSYTGPGPHWVTDAACLGDVDGDGEGDIAIGVPNATTRADYDGYIELVRGPLLGHSLAASGQRLVGAAVAYEQFGGELLVVPDGDGDGKQDLVAFEESSDGSYGYASFPAYVYVPSTLWL